MARDQVVGELFGRAVERRVAQLRELDGDGVQQVGLAQPDAAIDKQRVVERARPFGHGFRHGVRQLVVAAHDKVGERVPRIYLQAGQCRVAAPILPLPLLPLLVGANIVGSVRSPIGRASVAR